MLSTSSSDGLRLISLTIEGFRGFASETHFDLDASAVLLWGANGTGKTSVFDALEWLLVGEIPRLRGYTLRKNDEYIANLYRPGMDAHVEAHFRSSTQVARAARAGTAQGSQLEFTLDGATSTGLDATAALQDALTRSEMSLRDVLSTSGLLQQDELRELLQTRPDERYRLLLRLLGLEVLERFEHYSARKRDHARSALRETRKAVEQARDRVEVAMERLETAQLQAEVSVRTPAATSALDSLIPQFSDVLSLRNAPESIEEMAGIGAAARTTAAQAERVLQRARGLPSELPDDPTEDLKAIEASVKEIEARLRETQELLARATASIERASLTQDAYGRLAAAALPLIDHDHDPTPCPVCETPISPATVAARLQARAEGAAEVAETRSQFDQAQLLEQNEARLRDRTQEQFIQLDADRKRRSSAIATARDIVQAVSAIPAMLPNHLVALGSPESGITSHIDDLSDDALYSAWRASSLEVINWLERFSSALLAVADTADSVVAADTASRRAHESGSAIPRQEQQLDDLRARLSSLEEAYELARRQETAAVALAQGATTATAELFREQFDALEPLMNDIYARLDPHPAFTRLDFRVEPYRAKGTAVANVWDDEAQLEANPMLVFSSAQANAVVLTAFLALGWAADNRCLPFVLLDDPLQAMDDVNVLGFADLARKLRRQRQLVLATHEERFAGLLERKLTGRFEGEDLIVHRFLSWNREGPTVTSERIVPRTDLGLRVVAS